MKYLKTFESDLNPYYYNVGDYILLNKVKIPHLTGISFNAKILEIPDRSSGVITILLNNIEKKISVDKIERKLTPKEIEEFKLQQAVTKYNL